MALETSKFLKFNAHGQVVDVALFVRHGEEPEVRDPDPPRSEFRPPVPRFLEPREEPHS